MSLWSSIKKIGKSLVGGFSDMTKNKNPFTHSWSDMVSGMAGDVQDFAEGYTGERVANKNLEFQKEQFKYQKLLNEKQMQREDTSYQRKVADMTKAGFNPILASSGSGEPSAPLKSAPAPQLGDYSGGIRQGISDVFSLLSMRKDFAVKDAQIRLLRSEKDKNDAETINLEDKHEQNVIDIDYSRQTLSVRVADAVESLSYKKKNNAILDIDKVLKEQEKEYNLSRQDLIKQDIKLRGKEIDIKSKELLLKGAELVRISEENTAFKDKVKFWKSLGLPYDSHITKDTVLFGLFNLLTGGGDYTPQERLDAMVEVFSNLSSVKLLLNNVFSKPDGAKPNGNELPLHYIVPHGSDVPPTSWDLDMFDKAMEMYAKKHGNKPTPITDSILKAGGVFK